jgi:hypothetical protein
MGYIKDNYYNFIIMAEIIQITDYHDRNVSRLMQQYKNKNPIVPPAPPAPPLIGDNWIRQVASVNNDWRSVTWSDNLNLYAAVSSNGTNDRVMTSADGLSWITQTTPAGANIQWQSVTYSPTANVTGLFAAVATDGGTQQVMTSPDGITWTVRSVPVSNAWLRVKWATFLSSFVSLSFGTGQGTQQVMTSTNGITWVIRNSALNIGWRGLGVSESLGLLVAVGEGGNVMTSTDGINWILRSSGNSLDWQQVEWSAKLNLFIALASTGTGNRAMTSPDGIAWTIRTTPATDNEWRTLAVSDTANGIGLLIAGSSDGVGDRIMTSPDGIVWTSQTIPIDSIWQGSAWSPGNNRFVMVGFAGAVITTG